MKRISILVGLWVLAGASHAQNWQPLRAGYAYVHDAFRTTSLNEGENYVVADSASPDSNVIFLSKTWRAVATPQIMNALAHRYMRGHYLGTRCWKTGPGAWIYEVAEKGVPVAIPVSGSWQSGQTVNQPPYTLTAQKTGQPGGDSLLTWQLTSTDAGFETQSVIFSKQRGIRQFPFSVGITSTLPGLRELLAEPHKNRRVYAAFAPGQRPLLPIHAEEWATAQPGAQIVLRSKRALWMTYSDQAFALPVAQREVASADSVILRGLAQVAVQPYRYDLNNRLVADGAVYTDTATLAYTTTTRFLGDPLKDAFTPISRYYDASALLPSGTVYFLPSQNFIRNPGTGIYTRSYTSVSVKEINGEAYLYDNSNLTEMGRTMTLMEGPGLGSETRWQVSSTGSYTQNTVECYTRAGQASPCPDIRTLVTELPARSAGPAVRVAPNPFEETLYLQASEPVSYRLISSTGQMVGSGAAEAGLTAIAARNLPAGIYQIRIERTGGRVEQIRVVRQ